MFMSYIQSLLFVANSLRENTIICEVWNTALSVWLFKTENSPDKNAAVKIIRKNITTLYQFVPIVLSIVDI